MADQCLFCRIVSGEIPAKLVAQDATCIAFRDVNPQAPVHVLVVPRAHVQSLNEVASPALMADVLQMARAVAKQEGIAAGGYRVVFNTNADGGQSVRHLHAHVLGGRKLGWPPG
jgi:histidine triad (HIT) family protein